MAKEKKEEHHEHHAEHHPVHTEHVEHKTPTGVKVISICEYIAGGFLALLSFILFYLGLRWDAIKSQIPAEQLAQVPQVSNISAKLFLVTGLYYLLLAGLLIFIGIYLWKMKPWARLFHLIFYGLAVAWLVFGFIRVPSFGLIPVIAAIVKLVIYGLVLWYLGKKAKHLFK